MSSLVWTKCKELLKDIAAWFLPASRKFELGRYKKSFLCKTGLEIGGPSFLWRRQIPIYKWAKKIDNYDYSESAVRHLEGRGSNKFQYFLHKKGTQFIGSEDFSSIPAKAYDFVILRDVLEHTANPLKLLWSIREKITTGGAIVVVTPNKLGTYDYARPDTSFRHILEDFIADRGEDDNYHFQELKELLHDHIAPDYNTRDELNEIIDRNYENRRAHHHVFSLEVLSRCCSEAGFRTVIATSELFPHNIVVGIRYSDISLQLKPSMSSILKYES